MRRNKKDIAKKEVRRESYQYRCKCPQCTLESRHKANEVKAKEEITNFYKERS